MAILQAFFLMIFRSMGKILNTVFAWATIMLFGRVSQERQIFLSIMAFGSVLWLVSAVGIAFPSVATFLLAFVTIPKWVDNTWIRIAMLIAAAIIPAIVGTLTIFLVDKEERPAGAWLRVRSILSGYPYTFGLAVTLLFLTIVAPIVRLRQMAKRWTSVHIPVVVRPKDYEPIVADVKNALEQGEIKTEAQIASWTLRFPMSFLAAVARASKTNFVSASLRTLVAPTLEVYIYPADLAIFGTEHDVGRAHAVITERLAFTRAYLTHSKEGQQIEDKLRALWQVAQASAHGPQVQKLLDQFHKIEKEVGELDLAYDEWEALFRERMILERALLKAAAGIRESTGAVKKFLEAA